MFRLSTLTLAVLAAGLQTASAQVDHLHHHDAAEEMVITGVRTDVPLTVATDPRRPRQPLPAHDGADYLKTIPGFSVIRKGGTDGDPVLRGMAGSRLSMLVDGELILGGCNNRMDPPTAYVFPETFDAITVIKGPQSVRYGPGNSAGVVLFERETLNNAPEGWKLHTSMLAGSYGRYDEVVDARYTGERWELRGSASNAIADDYEDGDGNLVHSRYRRWNGQAELAWTPDADTRLSLGAALSDGEAAYADRGVDGSSFRRENLDIKFEKRHLSPLLSRLELQAYHNHVDHVMDNYSLRSPSGMASNPMAMNPERITRGAKAIMTLSLSGDTELTAGVDAQRNEHTSRSTMNQTLMPYAGMERMDDTRFDQVGVFTELSHIFLGDSRLVAGLRVDEWRVEDLRQGISLGMMQTVPNPAQGHVRKETLSSAFLRVEDRILDTGFTWFAGLGHNERFPDYWEITKESADALVSVASLDPEVNTQFDTGLIYAGDRFSASTSVFYSEVKDYIMIQTGVMKPAMMGAERMATIARNVDARTWGLELDGQYRLAEHWRAEFTLASVRGSNRTDNTHLAQLPPLETRLGLQYDNSVWSAGLLWRFIGAQDRVDIGKGNIVGQDIAVTPAADVLSLHAGWQLSARTQLTAGIDNLFDANYAEHISRAGAAIPGFEQSARVNEPGRVLWLKGRYSF